MGLTVERTTATRHADRADPGRVRRGPHYRLGLIDTPADIGGLGLRKFGAVLQDGPMPRDVPHAEPPDGLMYRPALLEEHEERLLLDLMDEVEFEEVRLHGVAARRTVAHFGYRYNYESRRLVPAAPLPPPLVALRERCGALAGAAPEQLAQALVTRYPAGSTIGWHRDAPAFGPKVVGVSMLSDCRMLLRREIEGTRRQYRLDVARRSAYVLGGVARSAWQHSIPATPGLRFSVTFRTVPDRQGAAIEDGPALLPGRHGTVPSA